MISYIHIVKITVFSVAKITKIYCMATKFSQRIYISVEKYMFGDKNRYYNRLNVMDNANMMFPKECQDLPACILLFINAM